MSIIVTVSSALAVGALVMVILGDDLDLTFLAIIGGSTLMLSLWSSSGDDRHAQILAVVEEIRGEEVEQTALLREQNRLLKKMAREDPSAGV